MLDDGLDDVHLEHTASVLLAHRARSTEVVNDVVVDPVAREKPVKVGSSLSNTTVFAIDHMRLLKVVFKAGLDWEVLRGPHEKSIEFKGSRRRCVGKLLEDEEVGRFSTRLKVGRKRVHPGEHISRRIISYHFIVSNHTLCNVIQSILGENTFARSIDRERIKQSFLPYPGIPRAPVD